MNRHAVVLALISAALFGVSTPAAKVLLGSIDPAILAGLLYCGAGLGVAIVRRLDLSVVSRSNAPEVALGRREFPWLAGAILTGGIVGPILLMTGLTRTDAAATSLLFTLEGVATALMAGQPSSSGLLGPIAIIGALERVDFDPLTNASS